jgi:Protein of unknown function (DUF3089)
VVRTWQRGLRSTRLTRMRSNLRFLPLLAAAAFVLAGIAPATGAAKTVWLCKPGAKPDPCTPGLSTTVYSPSGAKLSVTHPKAVRKPTFDCFYVYPTVSGQPTGNSNLQIDPEQNSIALYQAARYSQYCRVFAPMYRQLTLAGIGQGKPTTPANSKLPLSDVRSALKDYLLHYNHGRPFVLIGHSQGSFVLRQVIHLDVDPHPAVRKHMLSAILLGGNVMVKTGSDVGGDFKHVRACHSRTQLGCVVAWSTFDTPVVPTSLFGVSHTNGQSVLCTNPAAFNGGTGNVDLITPSASFDPKSLLFAGIQLLELTQPHPPTVWVEEPGAYHAACSSANNAHVLQITVRNGAQTPHFSPDATWGLHLLDAQIELGNLLTLVRTEAATYARTHK